VPPCGGRVLAGVTNAAGALPMRGGTGDAPPRASPSRSSRHEAAVHHCGLRLLLDSRPPGSAAGQTPPRPQARAAGGQQEQGLDAGESACAGSSLLHRTPGSAPGSVSRRWGPWELARTRALLCLGHDMGRQVAQSTWRDTHELPLEALHPETGRRPQSATPHARGAASTRVRVPGHLARQRGQPRNRLQDTGTSGTVRGVPGNRHSYRRD
jgi:hypothetical protein